MTRRRFLQISLLWLIGGFAARAEPIVWQGTAGSDWFDAANWDLLRVPGDNDAVLIDGAAAASGHVVLSNATAALASCIVTNATLVFTNWTTCLQAATVEVRDQGLLTLPPAYPDGAMSNRVHIVCTNFVLAAGGLIDASGKGYAGASGPKPGVTSNNRAGGGGHGGHGGQGENYGAYGGGEYDSLREPVAPGSGGGTGSGGYSGGAGGGVVRIEAASQVTVDGAIRADGDDAFYRGGGGSGGAISITCENFGGGTNGLLSASGGTQKHETLNGSGCGRRTHRDNHPVGSLHRRAAGHVHCVCRLRQRTHLGARRGRGLSAGHQRHLPRLAAAWNRTAGSLMTARSNHQFSFWGTPA